MSRSMWILILIAILVTAGIIVENQTNENTNDATTPIGLNVGEVAPNFKGKQLNGESFNLEDQRGVVVFVDVFASWCAPCRQEAPHLQRVYELLREDGVVFVGINLEEQKGAIQGFQKDFSITFPLLVNEDDELTDIYQPLGISTSWIINKDGIIAYVHAGPMTTEMLLEGIAIAKESG